MSDRTSAYASAVVALAKGEGALDAVDGELQTIARAVASSDELRDRLTDIQLPIEVRLKLVDSTVLAAAHPATRAALAMVIAAGRAADLVDIAAAVSTAVAAEREAEVAEVTVAAPLSAEKRDELKAALERATGKRLELQVLVDPTVIGGVRAKVGDTVIDGSLAKRIDDVRTRLAG